MRFLPACRVYEVNLGLRLVFHLFSLSDFPAEREDGLKEFRVGEWWNGWFPAFFLFMYFGVLFSMFEHSS